MSIVVVRRARRAHMPLGASVAVVLALAAALPAFAEGTDTERALASVVLPAAIAEGKVVCEVSGRIPGSPVTLDLETIMAFPSTTFTGLDPWDGKRHEFTGVELYPHLKRLGMPQDAAGIEVIASNAYKVSIRARDLKTDGYILAYRFDDALLREQPGLRKRGTLLIALDFAKHPELEVEVYKFHLVWQVKSIVAR